ncbi:MAG: hypothetical protein ACOH2A_10815 [Sphingobacteriaceae bacterium]
MIYYNAGAMPFLIPLLGIAGEVSLLISQTYERIKKQTSFFPNFINKAGILNLPALIIFKTAGFRHLLPYKLIAGT